MTDHDLLNEQLAYYRARAGEYDESVYQTGRYATEESSNPDLDWDWAQTLQALRNIGHPKHALELACGTGIWTTELVKIADAVTALDGAPEMLEVNRRKVNNPNVHYELVDLFNWQPQNTYDLVFFGFWLSHVPPEKLSDFLDSVTKAVGKGGRIFIVDEPANGILLSGPNENGVHQTRQLHDGRTFQIVKVYYDRATIQAELEKRDFGNFTSMNGDYFFYLCGQRS